MQGIVLNMKELAINTYRCEMKVKCFENPHYAYTYRCVALKKINIRLLTKVRSRFKLSKLTFIETFDNSCCIFAL